MRFLLLVSLLCIMPLAQSPADPQTKPQATASDAASNIEEMTFPSTVKGATNEQIKAVNNFYYKCENNLHTNLSSTHDCACYADALLKEWVNVSPDFRLDGIAIAINERNECIHADKQSQNAQYQTCISRFGKRNPVDMEPEAYCTCYADRWAELVNTYTGERLTVDAKRSLKSQSRGYCNDLGRAPPT